MRGDQQEIVEAPTEIIAESRAPWFEYDHKKITRWGTFCLGFTLGFVLATIAWTSLINSRHREAPPEGISVPPVQSTR